MLSKDRLRKKFFRLRKNKYYEIDKKFFSPLISFLKIKSKKKKINISTYYPTNYEVNILKLNSLIKNKKDLQFLLPVISLKNTMFFAKWNFLDTLQVNKYGILEPIKNSKKLVPDISLVPLLAFDKQNYRLGYGKGYYDKYFNKYLNINKSIITIGIAFSFQKYNKLPTSNYDVKLDFILTEKGLSKL